MIPAPTLRRSSVRRPITLLRNLSLACLSAGMFAATSAGAQVNSAAADPRIGLRGGWHDAAEAASNLELVAHRDRPEGFFNPTSPGDFGFVNADMAFRGNLVFLGGFNGIQIWDVTNPASPTLRTKFVCPGGQGDMSVYHNLLFMSVEATNGRVDCGAQGVTDTVSAERFRGVRVFDITDVEHPRQVAAVQTCRGSHTHTLVTDPRDPANVYIYVSGTAPVRSPNELAGCSKLAPEQDPHTSLYSIDVIRVPLAAPQNAKIVSSPRVFADLTTGAIAGLWKGGDHGAGTQSTSQTNQCHDITVYSAIGLAAGACSGNGILLDIREPANPKRVAAVSDSNFAYWHSATFNNDGTRLLYSDEWGGGMAARCRATDPQKWGADAIFTLTGTTLTPAGYYKLPVVQTAEENCVAHDGALVPIPGRDVMVQAWYQGGVSVFDFTDPAHVREIAFFDRGPEDPTKLVLGGFWSAYWYNGHIYGSEIGRGLDVLELTPSAELSQNEIDAAKLVQLDVFNPQNQPKFVWPARFVVARAYLDQLVRGKGLPGDRTASIGSELDRAEKLSGAQQRTALSQLATQLEHDASGSSDAARVHAMAGVVREIASAQR